MPAALTFPGVYIVEIPSGVQSITGVATSITAFIGDAAKGPTDSPQLILSLADYTRIFGQSKPNGYLGQAVSQFFSNGGAQCYVVRVVGAAAAAATATLNDITGTAALNISAISKGAWGNGIQLTVDYNTPNPDDTFNLTVVYSDSGKVVKTETLSNLSMDPSSASYAPNFIAQSSTLITATSVAAAPGTAGFSQARFPLVAADADSTPAVIAGLYPAAYGDTGNIQISVDGGPPTTATFSKAAIAGCANFAALVTYINGQINGALGASSGAQVTLSNDTPDTKTFFLRLTSSGTAKTRVDVQRASSNDLASLLMWGVAQGGIEMPMFGSVRPAPNGTWSVSTPMDIAGVMTNLAIATLGDFTNLTVGGNAVASGLAPTANLFTAQSTGGSDGIRTNLGVLANAVNSANTGWRAAVAGYHLYFTKISPNSAQDTDASFATTTAGSAADLGSSFAEFTAGTALGATAATAGQDAPPDLNAYLGQELNRTGLWAFDSVPLINLMVLPGDNITSEVEWETIRSQAAVYCESRRAFLLLDAPVGWTQNGLLNVQASDVQSFRSAIGGEPAQQNCAVFYPRVQVNDGGTLRYMGPSAMIAGLCAATDSARGVWVAPAGTTAGLNGVLGLEVNLTDKQNGILNPLAVNCIRSFPAGYVNWGARTVAGFDNSGDDDWKYIPVRRFGLFLEESLYEGTQWVVFQPNADPLWAQIRMNLGAFMMTLFRQGAFAGTTPQTAYFVKCDSETTTPSDQIAGVVNILVGFAPLRPAEFVVISIQQIVNLT